MGKDKIKNELTKRRLLNKLMDIMCDLDFDDRIRDLGEKSTEPHIHEFMIDGYMFEIRLIDKIK
ncbi:MAG: hypothetical protein WDA02_07470 [Saccharofermentanales bacterium]